MKKNILKKIILNKAMTKKEFKNEVNEIVVAVNRANKFLSNLGLSLSINWGYEFDGGDLSNAIGVYEGGSVFGGDISISCNLNRYTKMSSQINGCSFCIYIHL